jgi:peptidyl-prolyl cis-trans isomerase SurA
MTMAQLKEQLVKENLPYIKFRRQIQEQMLLSQLQQQMAGSQVSISEQEVTDFMHKNPPAAQGPVFYHLQDIVVEIPDEPTATQVQAAQTKAETLIGKLKTGKDFAAALKSFSVDEKTDDIQMNDLGWRNAQEVPSLFEKTVKNMKTGDIVGPIRAPNGFHVLKLEDKKVQGGEAKLTREDAKRLIYQQKLDNKLQEWVKKTRESAYIKIMTDKNKDKIKNKAKEESRPSTD